MNEGYWVRTNGGFLKVEGRPVHIIDGLETFAHRPLVWDDGSGKWGVHQATRDWELSDARTGMTFGISVQRRAATIKGAVEAAKDKLGEGAKVGGRLEEWRAGLNSLPVTPRYWDEYYDADTAPIKDKEA